MTRALYDCSAVPLTPTGPDVRLVVATHPATPFSPVVGTERDGTVYELFVSTLPSPAFTASDVLNLYLHRGSFETVLADEDDEQNMDRWYSHTPFGQEFAQILAQWVWNIRLELGQTLSPSELRTTEFAPALEAEAPSTDESEPVEVLTPPVIYGPPQWARPSFTHGFPGSTFTPQPDGTLRCPANHPLYPQERRPERDGSPRILYAARIGHCRSCRLRAQCQESSTTLKPRRVSAVLWLFSSSHSDSSPPPDPASSLPASAPVLWCDWPRCSIRRTWQKAGSQPNHRPEKLRSALATTRTSASREGLDPSGARALAAFLGPALGAQCSSDGCAPTGHHASWTPSRLCLFLWLRSACHGLISTSRHLLCFSLKVV